MAQVADTATAGSIIGYSVYSFIAAAMTESYSLSVLGASYGTITGLGGAFFIPYTKKVNTSRRKEELQEIVQTGATKKPYYSALRPLTILASGYLYVMLLLSKPVENENADTALTLGVLAGCAAIMFQITSSYFRSQLMTPPSTKKPFWKTTYEMVRNKFKPKQELEPAAEPIAKYAAEQRVLGH